MTRPRGPANLMLGHWLVGGTALFTGKFEMGSEHAEKGVAFSGVAQLHRVMGEAKADSRFEATHGLGMTGLVGRETEISLLLDRWDLAKDGEGQVVLLEGEAGIGNGDHFRAGRPRRTSSVITITGKIRHGLCCPNWG